jgi:hypothetical protein
VWFGDQTLPQIHDDQPRAGRAALAMGFARPALSSYTTCWDTTSMTAYANHRVWQDVYHVPSRQGLLYVKFTADAVAEFLLLSFKEKGDD